MKPVFDNTPVPTSGAIAVAPIAGTAFRVEGAAP
jgi:hypothetical protein